MEFQNIQEAINSIEEVALKDKYLERYRLCSCPENVEDLCRFMFGETPAGEDHSARLLLQQLPLKDVAESIVACLPEVKKPYKKELGYQALLNIYFEKKVPESVAKGLIALIASDMKFEEENNAPFMLSIMIQVLCLVTISCGSSFTLPEDFPKLSKRQQDAIGDSLNNSFKQLDSGLLPFKRYHFYYYAILGIFSQQLKQIWE